MHTFELAAPSNEDARTIPDWSQALSATVSLLLAATIGFFKGMLLCGLLNLIPILPAYKRSTFSLMSRCMAFFFFAPTALLLLLVSPLYCVGGVREKATGFCRWAVGWYGRTDLS